MNAEMGTFDVRLARDAAFQRKAPRLEGKVFLRLGEETVEAQSLEHVFEPRLLAVGAVAMIDERAHERERDRRAFLRADEQSAVAAEIPVPGDAAEQHAKIDAGRHALAPPARARRKADIGGVLKHRDAAAAVEADIEFARQAVKLAMLQDRVMQPAAERPRVDQFVRIDS